LTSEIEKTSKQGRAWEVMMMLSHHQGMPTVSHHACIMCFRIMPLNHHAFESSSVMPAPND